MEAKTTSTPHSPSLLSNMVAGLSVAGLLVPESIAYASIAGLGPIHALIACLAGLFIYACIGKSIYAVVSPTSSSATILASAVAALGASLLVAHNVAVLSAILVVLVGVFFLVAAAARLGYLSAFISRPVLRGFAFGLAITIVIKQLPLVAGLSLHGLNTLQTAEHLVLGVAQWNWWSIGVGVSAYLGLRLLKRIPMFPAAFVVIVLGVLATYFAGLAAHGVELVGAIDLSSLHIELPSFNLELWLRASELALPLTVILFAESWGSIRTLALKHGQVVDSNRELLALGAANLVSGLCQGLPVGAGFSASSANEDAGARSKLAGIMAASTILLLLLTASHWLALLPIPVLAAVVISALTHALNPKPLILLWRLGRDEILATIAVLVVIGFGVLYGMLFAVLLSVLLAMTRFSQTQVNILGQIGNTRDYVNIKNHPDAQVHPNILVVRPDAPLFFANVDRILAYVRTLAEAQPQATYIVLSLESSADFDSTALDSLNEFLAWINDSQRQLLLARVKDNVRQLLLKAEHSTPIATFWSVADAVASVDEPTL